MGCLLFLLLLYPVPILQGASPGSLAGNEVLAIGSGPVIGGNLAQARDHAISQALTKGMESYFVRRLGSRGAVANFPRLAAEILPASKEAVENFLILAEDQAGEKLNVLVKIRVNQELMDDRLRAAGLIVTEGPPVKMLFMVCETRGDSADFWWGNPEAHSNLTRTELALYDVFQERGFDPINRTLNLPEAELAPEMRSLELQDEAVLKWGKLFLADVVMYGQAKRTEAGEVILSLRALDVGRGVELARGEERTGGEVDPAKEEAFMKAVSDLAGRLAVRFSPAVIESVTSDLGQVIQMEVTLKGLTNYREFTVFRDFLRTEVTGVRSVRQTRVRLDSISISVEFQGNVNRFLNQVLNHENLPFPMTAVQMPEGGVVLTAR